MEAAYDAAVKAAAEIEVTVDVLEEVRAERERQDNKWGEQNHDPFLWSVVLGEEYGEVCQAALKSLYEAGKIEDYRKELIEVAAVAVAAIEALDRKKWNWRHTGQE